MEVLMPVLAAAVIGTMLGVLTGLVPGLHVNNVAIILLSISPLAVSILIGSVGMDQYTIFLTVSSAIVATSMAHTFLDFIPSTFLGAPEPETALSVLPAHGLLMEGKGYRAVFLSAVGSFGAVIMGSLLIIPYRFIVNEPVSGYEILKQYMVWVLIAVVIILLVTENTEVPYRRTSTSEGSRWEKGRFSRSLGILLAMGLFLLSGILGYAALSLEVRSPFGLPATVLFPLLSGLFGTSTLIESLRGGAEVPAQELDKGTVDLGEASSSITAGSISGSVVGFLPGMSGGVATIIANLFKKDPSPSSVILTLSAINTANSFFVLSALFLILRPRSGAAIVVEELIDTTQWNAVLPPNDLIFLLISALIASCMGFFLTLFLGKKLANVLPRVPYNRLVKGIILFIGAMVFAFTGPLGILILIISTLVGMIAPVMGIRRSHAMGVLLLPVILMIW